MATRVTQPKSNLKNLALKGQEALFSTEIPVLKSGAKIRMKDVRDRGELGYLAIIWGVNAALGIALIALLLSDFERLAPVLLFLAIGFWAFSYVSWKLLFIYIYGNSIEVGPAQYPQIHSVVRRHVSSWTSLFRQC